jgi:hypothetical protein
MVHFRFRGKRGKKPVRSVHAMVQRLIEEYLALAGYGADAAGPMFRPVTKQPHGRVSTCRSRLGLLALALSIEMFRNLGYGKHYGEISEKFT